MNKEYKTLYYALYAWHKHTWSNGETFRLMLVPNLERLEFNRNSIAPLRLHNVGCLTNGNGNKGWLAGQIDYLLHKLQTYTLTCNIARYSNIARHEGANRMMEAY